MIYLSLILHFLFLFAYNQDANYYQDSLDLFRSSVHRVIICKTYTFNWWTTSRTMINCPIQLLTHRLHKFIIGNVITRVMHDDKYYSLWRQKIFKKLHLK